MATATKGKRSKKRDEVKSEPDDKLRTAQADELREKSARAQSELFESRKASALEFAAYVADELEALKFPNLVDLLPWVEKYTDTQSEGQQRLLAIEIVEGYYQRLAPTLARLRSLPLLLAVELVRREAGDKKAADFVDELAKLRGADRQTMRGELKELSARVVNIPDLPADIRKRFNLGSGKSWWTDERAIKFAQIVDDVLYPAWKKIKPLTLQLRDSYGRDKEKVAKALAAHSTVTSLPKELKEALTDQERLEDCTLLDFAYVAKLGPQQLAFRHAALYLRDPKALRPKDDKKRFHSNRHYIDVRDRGRALRDDAD